MLRLWLDLLHLLRVCMPIENELVEMTCKTEHPDTPFCGNDHWRATGFQRQVFDVGPLSIPMSPFVEPHFGVMKQ